MRQRHQPDTGHGTRHGRYCHGQCGTDVALDTSDVSFMADGLSKLPFAVALNRASKRIIRQNL